MGSQSECGHGVRVGNEELGGPLGWHVHRGCHGTEGWHDWQEWLWGQGGHGVRVGMKTGWLGDEVKTK